MKQAHREKIQYAIGIIEGVSFAVLDAMGAALEIAENALLNVLADEGDAGKKNNRR